jgi:hypothetical protein
MLLVPTSVSFKVPVTVFHGISSFFHLIWRRPARLKGADLVDHIPLSDAFKIQAALKKVRRWHRQYSISDHHEIRDSFRDPRANGDWWRLWYGRNRPMKTDSNKGSQRWSRYCTTCSWNEISSFCRGSSYSRSYVDGRRRLIRSFKNSE